MTDLDKAKEDVVIAAKKVIICLGKGQSLSQLAHAIAVLDELEKLEVLNLEFSPLISSAPSYNKRYFVEWVRNMAKNVTKNERIKLPGVRER